MTQDLPGATIALSAGLAGSPHADRHAVRNRAVLSRATAPASQAAVPAGIAPRPAGLLSLPRVKSPATGPADFELAKWLALLAMVIDHYGKIVDPDLFAMTHAVGRISFPLFAAIIGMRLAMRPDLASAYIRRLLPWALISRPIFVFVGRDWYDGNILLTLLVGILAAMLLRKYVQNRSHSAIAGVVALLPIAWFCEFSIIGAAMVPVTTLLTSRRIRAGQWATGPFGIAANLSLAWPMIGLIDLTALLGSAVMIASVRLKLSLPRLPVHVFYGIYPAHLLALHIVDVGL